MTKKGGPSIEDLAKRRLDGSCEEMKHLLSNIATVILAGGKGQRLMPLTKYRAKPAVPLKGSLRLIDVSIEAARRVSLGPVFLATQYQEESILRHLKHRGIHRKLQVLSGHEVGGYQGTSDVIRKNSFLLRQCGAEYFLILSGDQIHNLDIPSFITRAQKQNRPCCVSSIPVSERDAPRFGILKQSPEGRIQQFHEKPADKELLRSLRSFSQSSKKPFLGSMGIYLFKKNSLIHLLDQHPFLDFGQEVIPHYVKEGIASTVMHPGHWKDIGTIPYYFETLLRLYPRRSFPLCRTKNTVFLEEHHARQTVVGRHCHLSNVIVDVGVHIGHHVHLECPPNYPDIDTPSISTRNGVVIVKQNAHLEDGFTLPQ